MDFVASSQSSFPNTPFIVPSSPTGPEKEQGENPRQPPSLDPRLLLKPAPLHRCR